MDNEELTKGLEKLSVGQLLDLEETIIEILRRKAGRTRGRDWRSELRAISEWSHLSPTRSVVRTLNWKIETY